LHPKTYAARVAAPRIGAAFSLAAALSLAILSVAHAALPTSIEQLVDAAMRPAVAPVAAAAPAPQPTPPAPFIVFAEPAPGHAIDSPFGLRRLPWEAHGRLHAGVDIAAPLGTPVLAAADGVVTRAGTSPSYGRFVEVSHAGGLSTFYAHLKSAAVDTGAPVKAGEPVGAMGSSGDSTGPHLHFELREGDRRLNPVLFLGRTFAQQSDLPIEAAALVAPQVRQAVVSSTPKSRRGIRFASNGRVHGTVRMRG
jgi:murein DD-endopeptidase MepM/ murein hydrolase activator NlpD